MHETGRQNRRLYHYHRRNSAYSAYVVRCATGGPGRLAARAGGMVGWPVRDRGAGAKGAGMQWADLAAPEVTSERMRATVTVLPVAAIEQHGPHLPLSVDTDIVTAVVAAAIGLLDPGVPLLVLPAQPVGFSPEHDRFPGTLSLDPETLRRLWTDLATAVHRAGGRRLLIVNGHGGNPPVMDIVARDLRSRLGMLVGRVNSADLGTPARWFPEDELRFGIHGGAVETALMLHLHPDKVRRAAIRPFPSAAARQQRQAAADGRTGAIGWHGPHAIGWQAQDLNPAGAVGDPTGATAAAGQALFAAMATDLAAIIRDMARLPLPGIATGDATSDAAGDAAGDASDGPAG